MSIDCALGARKAEMCTFDKEKPGDWHCGDIRFKVIILRGQCMEKRSQLRQD